MRILFFTNLHPTPWQPGRAIFNANLAAGLRTAGHEVQVVVPVDWRDQRNAPQGNRAEAEFLPWFHPPLLRRDLWHRWMWLSVGATLTRIARRFAPDVILGGWLHPDGAVALRLGRELDRPVAVLAGGSDLLVLPRAARRRRQVIRVLDAADVILTHGQHLRNAALALGASPERTIGFYRGVDPRRFHPGDRALARERLRLPADTSILLSVGNLVPVKGHDVLVEALGRDELSGRAWHWYHLGDGERHAELQRRVAELGLDDRVTFAGRVVHADLPDWYRAADLQVLPSRSEGLPNVLMEGLACGLPFVASAVGGVPEIAESPDWLVPADEPGPLASAIGRALDAPARVARAVPTRDAGIATVVEALRTTLAGAA